MVLGADGRKMSKSLKNYVAAPEVLNKNGADATRQWAASGGATGSDIPYRAQDVEYGKRFLNKLWNASSFTANLLADYKPQAREDLQLQPLDKWILSKAENLTLKVTEEFEKCQFNIGVEDARNFTWHVFCDNYIEAVKERLYNPDLPMSTKRLAAQYCLYEVLYRMLQLLAPIIPHITEEIYQHMYKENKGYQSLQVSPWPKFNAALVDEQAEKNGDLIIEVIKQGRQIKAEQKLPLNLPLTHLVIETGSAANAKVLNESSADMCGTLKAEKVNINVIGKKIITADQINPSDVYVKIAFDKDYKRE
jgi:valyl-tRNA synthetase